MTVISLDQLRETALIAGSELELAPAEAIMLYARRPPGASRRAP